MPKLTKKEDLFLSRLRDQGGRLAISGNKYDRLIKAGYVLSEDDGFQTGYCPILRSRQPAGGLWRFMRRKREAVFTHHQNAPAGFPGPRQDREAHEQHYGHQNTDYLRCIL
jgi:hypothetical protein